MLTYTLRYLELSDPMFSKIADKISHSYPNSCILWIQELENSELLAAYNNRKLVMQLDDRTAKHVVEKQLFHGTKASVIRSICQNGFLTSCNKRAGFGKGTYLSPSAAYSFPYMLYGDHDEINGGQVSYMFYVDALLGRPLTFDGTKFQLGQEEIDPEKYDHGVGVLGNEIVISQDDAIYPRYVIAFHKNPVYTKEQTATYMPL